MSDQLDIEEVRQYFLSQLEANKQVIQDLSDEKLEKIAGGVVQWKSLAVGGIAAAVTPWMTQGMFANDRLQAAAKAQVAQVQAAAQAPAVVK